MTVQQQDFFQHLRASIADNTFVRVTLSKPRQKTADLKKVYIKPAIIRKNLMLTFTLRHQTKDITKNFSIEDGLREIQKYHGDIFLIASQFNTDKDWLLKAGKKGKFSLRNTPPTFTTAPELTHDKQKNHIVKGADYLTELGVTNSKGQVNKDMGDKFKQINKFVEIIAGLVEKADFLQKKRAIKVTDMGAGKGYLTFAIYDYLVNKMNLESEVVGVEIRPDLIELCNAAAQKIEFQGLSFEEGYIGNYDLQKTDVLIALHACDTATDDAIQKGIAAGAELIICAPCCHKQVRKAMTHSKTLDSVLSYGILKERQAEIITDTIRALLLEANGYKTKVFEFISTEHTGKNVMVIGTKHNRSVEKEKYQVEIQKLKQEFGIDQHYLETIL